MDNGIDQASERLAASLREVIQVFEAQEKQAAIARERAEKTREIFTQRMTRWRERTAGTPPSEAAESLPSRMDASITLDAVREDARSSEQLDLRWETAFCDINEALMHLYAYPSARTVAESITAKIRALRLLQVASFDESEPFFSPPSLKPETSEAPLREQALSFVLEMDRHLDTVQDIFQEKTQRTAKYLQEALEEAETFVASLDR